MFNLKYAGPFAIIMLGTLLLHGCKKLVEIDPPVDTITTKEIFTSNKQAEWAISALYSKMINGTSHLFIRDAAENNFASGLATILGGVSSDELVPSPDFTGRPYHYFNTNSLTLTTGDKAATLWETCYRTIFDANAVIEGIAESTSPGLTDSVRKQLTGEALAIRAFTYFYLVNYFGELPLVLTIDFNQTVRIARSPAAKVYEQIIADLKLAKTLLADQQIGLNNERVRVSKWFAEALLARASLFSGDYQQAVTSATNVINERSRFELEPALSNVFLAQSREAIFQLKQTSESPDLNNATPEGYKFNPINNGVMFRLRDEWVNTFDAMDDRKAAWVGTVNNTFYPYKYKVGSAGGGQPEYYMVMRLAELYLIRAEALMLTSPDNTGAAIADLNELRGRANATLLLNTLTAQQVTDAIAAERQFELFAEWGHRWFDLKRTGKASQVLSAMTYKQPWLGDYQLLYPIPVSEIRNNNNLSQNPLYGNQ